MIILNILINVLNIVVLIYLFNKCKNEKSISNYFVFLFSYLISGIITGFLYDNIIFTYIICSIVYSVLYKIKRKDKYQITDFLLMINIILISSIITAIPMIFIGYNNNYILCNLLIILIMFYIPKKINFNKYYKKILPNWNKKKNNKIKSVTLRNLILIISYLLITLINMFLNNYFITVYTSLL